MMSRKRKIPAMRRNEVNIIIVNVLNRYVKWRFRGLARLYTYVLEVIYIFLFIYTVGTFGPGRNPNKICTLDTHGTKYRYRKRYGIPRITFLTASKNKTYIKLLSRKFIGTT